MAGDPELQRRLQHVYWIGGGSGAGKTTVARRLAERYGLRYCGTDESMQDHARRTTAAEAPLLHQFIGMSMDERWVDRSPATMYETFHWFHGEGFHLIVEDLLAMPPGQGIVVEGFRLLPSLVAPLLADRSRAVWLLPTPDFRAFAIDNRAKTPTGPPGFVHRTSDPERAGRNIAERDRYFVERLRIETRELGLQAITVDAAGENESVDHVAEHFGLA
ncbi:shikimate kinase [Glycomyces niveus]|uniref:Uncharacterized protein n=1 Tax=Glycomyces niveus TaxID=2820287 RepID=A0ABS3UA65_9ACTN|nr:shikimate kinase [Glycomyces sp. NEAU-S30]MBO3735667.1 hypothetical protein [Glycomyces sp. NEAU-S30]